MIEPMRPQLLSPGSGTDEAGWLAVRLAVAAEDERVWERQPATRRHPSRRGERSTSSPTGRRLTAWK
jgi:hypothetical protein